MLLHSPKAMLPSHLLPRHSAHFFPSLYPFPSQLQNLLALAFGLEPAEFSGKKRQTIQFVDEIWYAQ
jgi:hypothetical protein